MNRQSSAWTGRAPRTMEGAFGAHVRSTGLQPMPDPVSERDERWTLAYVITCVLGLLACLYVGNQGPSDIQTAQDVAAEVAAVQQEAAAVRRAETVARRAP